MVNRFVGSAIERQAFPAEPLLKYFFIWSVISINYTCNNSTLGIQCRLAHWTTFSSGKPRSLGHAPGGPMSEAVVCLKHSRFQSATYRPMIKTNIIGTSFALYMDGVGLAESHTKHKHLHLPQDYQEIFFFSYSADPPSEQPGLRKGYSADPLSGQPSKWADNTGRIQARWRLFPVHLDGALLTDYFSCFISF